jgi:hypothetical protein
VSRRGAASGAQWPRIARDLTIGLSERDEAGQAVPDHNLRWRLALGYGELRLMLWPLDAAIAMTEDLTPFCVSKATLACSPLAAWLSSRRGAEATARFQGTDAIRRDRVTAGAGERLRFSQRS